MKVENNGYVGLDVDELDLGGGNGVGGNMGAKCSRGTKLGGGGAHGWEEDGQWKLERDQKL